LGKSGLYPNRGVRKKDRILNAQRRGNSDEGKHTSQCSSMEKKIIKKSYSETEKGPVSEDYSGGPPERNDQKGKSPENQKSFFSDKGGEQAHVEAGNVNQRTKT